MRKPHITMMRSLAVEIHLFSYATHAAVWVVYLGTVQLEGESDGDMMRTPDGGAMIVAQTFHQTVEGAFDHAQHTDWLAVGTLQESEVFLHL